MSLIKAIADWRPRTPFYYGWLVLGVAALGAYASTGVAQVVLGGIQNLIFEDMGWKRSTIAYAVTAGTWTSGLVSPLIGRLADRHGPRWLMPVAAIIVGICYLGLGGINAVWHFYIAYMIGRVIAQPNLVGVVPRTVAVNFFRRRRNLALGLTSMARPVGGAINIQLISLIAAVSSWRVAYRYLGLFTMALAVPLFLVMRRRPEDLGLRPDGDPNPPPGEAGRQRAGVAGARPSAGAKEFDWRVGEAAFTSTFWIIVIAESAVILTDGAVGFQIVPYLRDSGLSQAAAAAGLSLSSLFGALVNPGWGYLSDKFSPRKLALVAVTITAAIATLFFVIHSGGMGFWVIILWGTAHGGLTILGSMMLAQYYGRSSFGSISGLVDPFRTGALGLGPTLGAVLFALTGGYRALFMAAMVSYVLAFVLLFAVRAPKLPARALASSPAADG